MAKGDQQDFYTRLQALLPSGWFEKPRPVVKGVLSASAHALSWCYRLFLYARLQTRLSTCSEGWLDMAAYDFFGDGLRRPSGMSDEQFRHQIHIALFQERGTRQAIIQTLQVLTGSTPAIFEPLCPQDTGAYGGPSIGYGAAGGYGSRSLPYQAFVVVNRPRSRGIPWVAGYRTETGGYGVPSRGQYVSRDMIVGSVTDAQIYAAVAAVKLEGTLVWVRLQ